MKARSITASFAVLLVCVLLAAEGALGQGAPLGTLRGQVTDPSGAVVSQAAISATSSSGKTLTTRSSREGTYEITGLEPGTYAVSATAKRLTFNAENVTVAPGQVQKLNIPLAIEVQQENVTVEAEPTGPTVDVAPENNASSIVIKGKDLEALSDDPDELQSELQALAGPSAGPNGGQIYIDGFTGGQLPPKSSIREIRINQNPFAAEYDKLGYGRIEIFTKPGTNQYHGQFFFNDNNSVFNTGNPFVSQIPSYQTELFNGNVSGPLGKKASFFVNAERRNINDFSVINAVVLDPSFNPAPFTQTLANPRTRTNVSPRLDLQLGEHNTLMVRYQFVQDNETNDGVGQFALPSQAYNLSNTEQTLQISDTQIISPTIINETRFQYVRDRNNLASQSSQPTISVLGAFTGGGNPLQNVIDNQDHYELQNFTSIAHKKHFIKFGGRLRATRDANNATSNFNGTFTFSSLTAYQITQSGLQQGLTPAQIRAAGGGASQFSIITGQPTARVTMLDAGLYAQDEWRIRSYMSLSYGLRFETQNNIHDHADFAPRISFSWGLGHGKTPPKTILRAGWGIFYDRFTYDLLLQAERLNGLTQTQTTVDSPDFYPSVPAASQLSSSVISPTLYRIAPDLMAPYIMQTAVSIERQLKKNATVSLTYLNSRGEHQLFLRNINAPLAGTYNPADPSSAVRPLGGTSNIYEYDSSGIFRQNQLITNVRFALGSKVSLFGYYGLNFAKSDLGAPSGTFSAASPSGGSGFSLGGATSTPNFVSNSYDPMADYGRAAFDVRHRVFLAGTISLPYAFRLSPFMIFTSGRPFNITVGQDLNGDSIFNDRPAFATASTPAGNVRSTPYGTFNLVPAAGQSVIPINYGTGPALFTFNLRVSKTFGIGPKVERGSNGAPSGGPGGHGGRGGGPGGLGGRGLSGAGGPGGGPFGNAGSDYPTLQPDTQRDRAESIQPC